ncbi:hypothetical protein COU14_01270 [Candidatus Kaiserbacteria bacterium CG10_big_fil_rev_8_21_14_0_10_44_10]|uniref:Capsule synthesis protein CapA domain-containing protein n=1 Tax=Candidatus Kaiserbacteria bacterium CG10_big_fil_rev_8_21_14_0_10_44_10 TaxID=1974606 RepID=A0A2H0UJQ5_9BACT|nr:MAG: hypothetical protein COU14_01270 [Candidatus Kaiserbacteria bacterium CG10_big_fil_rev_8_21_14_0_10_44_10]
MHTRAILVSIFLAAVLCGGTFTYVVLNYGVGPLVTLPTIMAEAMVGVSDMEEVEPISIIFTGDVMLARDVEMRLLQEERGYSLSSIKDSLKADAVVMNFEASVLENHEQTQHMEMKFSVRPDLVGELRLESPVYLSLANNHSLDYGVGGYRNTVKTLEAHGFKAFGHATSISTSSVSVIEAKGQRVLVLHANATYGSLDMSKVQNILKSAGPADLTVAYIHWGTEYEPVNDDAQESLAHDLIDSGFDLVVGHHPHVVQNVERYKDGLIFYSLGNFVFDQYWTPEVQEGLVVKVVGDSKQWGVELMPVESASTLIQPRPMATGAHQRFLDDLAGRSSPVLYTDIAKGRIMLQF